MKIRAQVVAVEGRRALVRPVSEGCGRCREPGGCGGVSIAGMFTTVPEEVWASLSARVQVGDVVEISLADEAAALAALAWGLPVLTCLAGAGIGMLIAPGVTQEFYTMLGAVLGLMGGVWLTWLGPLSSRKSDEPFRIERRIESHEVCSKQKSPS